MSSYTMTVGDKVVISDDIGIVFTDIVDVIRKVSPTFYSIRCLEHYLHIEQDGEKIYVLVNDNSDFQVHRLVFDLGNVG